MADQNPLSSRGSILQDTLRTVPRRSTGNNSERTPAEITQYYQSKRGRVGSFRYPRGVGELPEYPHWLKIEIHKRNNAQVAGLTRGTSGAFVSAEAAAGDRVDPSNAAVRGNIGALVGAGATAGAAGAFSKVGSLFGTTGAIAGAAVGVATTAVAGVGGAIAGRVGDALGQGEYVTLSSVIGLGLQEPPTVTYRTTWESQDLGELLTTGRASPGSAAAEVARQKAGMTGDFGKAVGAANVAGASETARGEIRNPYKQQLFRSVEYRTFGFNFSFLPDSIDEAKEIYNLIQLLRETMLPTRSDNAYYLVYPAEYTLTYMYKNDRNENVPGIGTCALTDVGVRYGGNDFVTFKNSEGKPAEIGLSLSFKEIVPLTANAAAERNL